MGSQRIRHDWAANTYVVFPVGFSYTAFIMLKEFPSVYSFDSFYPLSRWYYWRTCLPMQETQETQVRFLSREDPLEKEMATHSSIRAWETSWREKPGGIQSIRSQNARVDSAIPLSLNRDKALLNKPSLIGSHSSILRKNKKETSLPTAFWKRYSTLKIIRMKIYHKVL